ncbi:glutamate receptor ionotropic, kainate glr-3-like [Uranotaenia lowii]|uniref:glutamate receptor ionotropic, kainate glr-3-like n=1 Tax=Uranotaenia lowii TaxID=190385 RepID=UPI0024784611|nr:glutamate receptor ionotropic, kainate glr-3-like [Uranotaenia lowii]
MLKLLIVLTCSIQFSWGYQNFGPENFAEISISYFKARNVKSVTAIGCFNASDHFEVMKSFMENDFYIQLLPSFGSYFNVSGMKNSGVVIDARCEELLSSLIFHENINAFMLTHVYWLFLDESSTSPLTEANGEPTDLSQVQEKFDFLFRNVDVLPTTHVVVGVFTDDWNLFDSYKPCWPQKVKFVEISCANESLSLVENIRQGLWNVESKPKERRNLHHCFISSGTAITVPEHYKGMDDHTDTIHDLFAKANFPFIRALMYDLNFTLNLRQVDKGGWKTNGTFSGLMGEFQRRTIELGGMGMLMRSERMEVVDYTIVTLVIKTSFVFKQPPLSLVSNIFELPFSIGVWVSCVGFVMIYWVGLMLFRAITKTERFTPLDSLMYIVGTLCQQNLELFPKYEGAKILLFWVQLANFFIFTSYSASIVALLQSPSRSITSMADLASSPLKAGAQDVVYAWVYLNESKDPAVQSLFRKKIKPFGTKAFTEAEVGMKRVKDELYAYQAEVNAAYRLIMETFTPDDTCKVYELDAIKLPPFSVPVVKGSKYRELFKQRLIWQREVGIIRRFNLIWIAQKPTCEEGAAEFTSVGLKELRHSYYVMLVGFGIAFIILAFEFGWKKKKNRTQVGTAWVNTRSTKQKKNLKIC